MASLGKGSTEPNSVHVKIPTEILQSILLAGDIPEYPDDRPTIESIRSVSRQWNDAAIHTPELWTRVNIKPQNYNSYCYGANMNSLRTWLDRSLNRTLNINIQFPIGCGLKVTEAQQDALLSCISDKVASWSYLRVAAKAKFLNRVLHLTPSATSLKTFEFCMLRRLPGQWLDVIPLYGITKLSVSYSGLGQLPKVQSNSIKSLALSRVETFIPELLSLLLQMPALQHLELIDVKLEEPWGAPMAQHSPVMALKNLTSIRVGCSEPETIYDHLPYYMTFVKMASGSLEKLEFSPSFNVNSRLPNLPRLQALELRLFTGHLDVHSFYQLDQTDASNIASSCPALRTISVTWEISVDKYDDDLNPVSLTEFVKFLATRDAESRLPCPELESLTLENLHVDPESIEELSLVRTLVPNQCPNAQILHAGTKFRLTLLNCYDSLSYLFSSHEESEDWGGESSESNSEEVEEECTWDSDSE